MIPINIQSSNTKCKSLALAVFFFSIPSKILARGQAINEDPRGFTKFIETWKWGALRRLLLLTGKWDHNFGELVEMVDDLYEFWVTKPLLGVAFCSNADEQTKLFLQDNENQQKLLLKDVKTGSLTKEDCDRKIKRLLRRKAYLQNKILELQDSQEKFVQRSLMQTVKAKLLDVVKHLEDNEMLFEKYPIQVAVDDVEAIKSDIKLMFVGHDETPLQLFEDIFSNSPVFVIIKKFAKWRSKIDLSQCSPATSASECLVELLKYFDYCRSNNKIPSLSVTRNLKLEILLFLPRSFDCEVEERDTYAGEELGISQRPNFV